MFFKKLQYALDFAYVYQCLASLIFVLRDNRLQMQMLLLEIALALFLALFTLMN